MAAGPASAAVARKVVTIVFADLIGSTALHERLDPESVSRLMEGYHAAVRVPIEAHGGTVVQLLGDGVMCAFGVPRVAEDDALRAVRAAVEVQRSFREFLGEHSELEGRVGLRVAVNTGEVVVSDDYAAGIGDPLNVAARLQQEAKDGDVLVGESTQRLVAERVTLARVGSFALKGRAEPVTAYRVESLERPAGVRAVSFVGRDDELARILAVFDAAAGERRARLAVILGSPGLGKSRVLAELARRLGDRAGVIAAHCNAAGGATFAPIAEALRRHLALGDDVSGDALRRALEERLPSEEAERARIARGVAALLSGAPDSPEETFFVLRRLLGALAVEKPVVLAIDDLQWAEPLLLDLVEHLVQWGAGVPLLVLVAARPELRDTRSSLTSSGGLVSDVVTLGGLDAVAASRLAANVIGADALPAAVAGRVLATSEGNPLFLGELVRMLVNDGVLRREGNRWTTSAALAELEMPPTIQALLAARIERLRPEERSVLERAAVIGRQFSRTALAQLLPREVHVELDARLESLRRSELVEPDTGWLLGEPALRFHHGMIRDAAYRRVLRNTRADLHARFADWLEARAGEAIEHEETIGWHLEQAHLHLRELGPLDGAGRALGERAAGRLAKAGRRALARDDLGPAASLLGRALACLAPSDPARADLARDWCEALLAAGEVGAASEAVAELGRLCGESERLRAWHTCFGAELAVATDPQALRSSADAAAAAAATLTAAADAAGEAKAHAVHALALARLGKIGACETALDHALAAARRADDRRRSNQVLAGAPVAALWGPSPVTRASGRCLDVVRVLRITQGAPAVEAVALSCQAVLETLRGRGDAARRMIASSRRMVEELGITRRVLDADGFAGLIELLEGDAVAAERWLRGAYDGLREHGLGIDAAQSAALLGRALLAQGRAAEAEAVSQESEALAGDDFKAAIAWRGVRAEALARRGEHQAALGFARAAVEIAAATDDLLDHADARSALAVALRAAGRAAEAEREEQRAIELWEQKGATLLVERARRSAAPAPRPALQHGVEAKPPAVARRRVRPNGVTAAWDRLVAALSAGDADAAVALVSESTEAVHHPTGTRYGKEGALSTWRRLLRARNPSFSCEPLATLGESLALSRFLTTGAGVGSGRFDVDRYEGEAIIIGEIDAEGLVVRTESFASDRLGDAVGRLYERYAELLPEGPERTRAEATARCVATLAGSFDLDRYAAVMAPDIELVDRGTIATFSASGPDAVQRQVSSWPMVADGYAVRFEDILALGPDAVLACWTGTGTGRASGGAFEGGRLVLWSFAADGLVSRIELFEAEHAAEALARFEALAAPEGGARLVRRRVRPNAATAIWERVSAAFAARDVEAFEATLSDSIVEVSHVVGASWGREASIAAVRGLLRSRDTRFRHEPLATLGERLGLARWGISASGTGEGRFDVGAYEGEQVMVTEVDNERTLRNETFAADRLGDAIARLYERYAELLPEGPERARAAATARAVAVVVGPFDLGLYATAIAPAVEFIDHRTLGFPSGRGAEALLRSIGTLLEAASDVGTRVDDVLGLRSDALLMRWRTSGTDRVSGGGFEWAFLRLCVFGADGRLVRAEQFDPDRDAEALARFDELTADRIPPPPRRRVRPNAATLHSARLDAAVAARDTAGIADLFADAVESVDHPLSLASDRQGHLLSFRMLLSAREPTHRSEPLGSLGETLALVRASVSASGLERGLLDVGAYEHERITLKEVDVRGRAVRLEHFATDQLGDAVTRLYERYAELLPEGPESVRATVTTRLIAGLHGSPHPGRWGSGLAPAVELVDHRILGVGSVQGADALVEIVRPLLELSQGVPTTRFDDVLGTRSDALLVRCTNSGTVRVSGGVYERQHLLLLRFGADGCLTRIEQFDYDRDAEALARFDALTSEPRAARVVDRRVRPNAATANAARIEAAVAAHDAGALGDLIADAMEAIDHPMALTHGRRQMLQQFRMLLGAERPALRYEPLASLGDSLALFHESISASAVKGGELDVGGYEHASVQLLEADAAGRMLRSEAFTVDRLGEAIVRLYERYAELLPEGPTRARAAARARSFATQLVRLASERYANTLAPDVECVDHRVLGTWSARGAEAVMRNLGSLPVLAHGISMCIDDVLRLEHDALLVRGQARGTDRVGGGVFETTPMLAVVIAGDDGRLTRIEVFDVDRKADALARFDELSAHRAPRIQNAASRATEGFRAAFEARDWAGVAALIASGFRQSDRRKTAQIEMDREGYLAGLRFLFDVAAPAYTCELLATRGDRLALSRAVLRGAGAEVGPFESELLALVEVDEEGRQLGRVTFDAGDLDAAYAELDARYVAGEAAPFPAVAAGGRAFVAAATARDWDALSALLAPDLVVDDHRPLGWGTLHGPVSLVDSWKALVELAPDVHVRVDHAMVTHSVSLAVFTLLGTREGGAFEDERVVVHQYDGNGRICRHEIYSLDQLDEARARFASRAANACRASLAALVPPNAATAAYDREQAAFEARDWAALRAVFAPLARIDDRRSLVGIPVDPDQLVTDKMRFAEAEDARYERRLVATFGDRIDLERGVASGGPAGGRFEIEVLTMTEVDEAGQIVLRVTFDAGAGRAARREAAARLVAGDPVAASLSPILELIEASNDHDLTRMRAVLADDFVNEDHRRTGVGRIEGVDAYLESIAATRGLVRDAQIEILSVRAIERHGVVGTMRSFGTLGDGGEFEAVWAVVSIVAGGRITRSEIFEIDQLDPALARFEELCAGCEAQEARGRDTPST